MILPNTYQISQQWVVQNSIAFSLKVQVGSGRHDMLLATHGGNFIEIHWN